MSFAKLKRKQQHHHHYHLYLSIKNRHQLNHSINTILMPSYDIINFRKFNRLLLMIAIALCSSTMTIVLAVDQHNNNINSSMEYSSTIIKNKLTSSPLMRQKLSDIANDDDSGGGNATFADVLVLIHHQETMTNHRYNNDVAENDNYVNDNKNGNTNISSIQIMHENFREFIELFGIKLNPHHVDFQFVDGKLNFCLHYFVICIILISSYFYINYPFFCFAILYLFVDRLTLIHSLR